MYGLDTMISGTGTDYNEVVDQVTFIDNHDMSRFATGSNDRQVDQALALTLTSRGVPGIYYGTEQYLTGGTDPVNRKFMPSYSTTTNAYKVISKLAPLRKSNPAFAYGTTEQRWINNDVYIYERKFGNNVGVVAINRSTTTGYNITGLSTSLPAGTYNDVVTGLLDGNSITVSGAGAVTTFNLGAGEAGVWQYTAAPTAPVVGHVGPMMGVAAKEITIDGRGFGATKGTVYFGATAVTGAQITGWEDTQIKVEIPSITAGLYDVKIKTSGAVNSNIYDKFEVLTAKQVVVRFVVQVATTSPGQNLYLTGNVAELGYWDTSKAIGPMFNQVIWSYPNWYYDVSVPAGTSLEFKFVKINGGVVTWEGGSNHMFTTPASAAGQTIVTWQP